jgi:hypothetical protein
MLWNIRFAFQEWCMLGKTPIGDPMGRALE